MKKNNNVFQVILYNAALSVLNAAFRHKEAIGLFETMKQVLLQK